jgi:GGDEF domain-containing protein
MKRNLRWLIPLLIVTFLISVALLISAGIVKENVIRDEIGRLTNAISNGTDGSEIAVFCNATAVCSTTSRALGTLDYDADIVEIVDWADYVIDSTACYSAVVCDEEGDGYNNHGEKVSLKEETFFASIKENYGNGGSGFSLVEESSEQYPVGDVVVVNNVKFAGDKSGYLLAFLNTDHTADEIFGEGVFVDYGALVTLNGEIIAKMDEGRSDHILYVWDDAGVELPKDAIKLSINQKKRFDAEIEGYGYLICVPCKSTYGAAIALISFEEMERHIAYNTGSFYGMAILIIVIQLSFALFIFAISVISDYLRKKRIKKIGGEDKVDLLTGLYSEDGAMSAIDDYICETPNKQGVMFIINIYGFPTYKITKGEDAAIRRQKEFAAELAGTFRATDIVARFSEERYVVFVKNLMEDREIRRKSDDIQLILHDTREQIKNEKAELLPFAGGAVYPKDGGTAKELLEKAVAAAEKAKDSGQSHVRFYGAE